MASTYTIAAIPPQTLAQLRKQDDSDNPPEPHREADQPLRCCLRRSRSGEDLLLVSYAPLRRWALETGAAVGPYLETGPVFIHAADCGGPAEPGIPTAMLGERRVCRAYDVNGRIRGGVLVENNDPDSPSLAQTLASQFADPATALVHVRAVEYGCFQFEAHRN